MHRIDVLAGEHDDRFAALKGAVLHRALDDELQKLAQEAAEKLKSAEAVPREFVRDPVLLEFLGLPNAGKLLESKLEEALIGNLQAFLLELGKSFAFVASQQRISTESKDFYVDLVFYHYVLKCFVLFDLKTEELTHQDIGQMDMYVRMYDDLRRGPEDNPTVGNGPPPATWSYRQLLRVRVD